LTPAPGAAQQPGAKAAGTGHCPNIRSSRFQGIASVDQLTARLPNRAWQQRSAGPGSKGHRYYSWAWLEILPEADPPHTQTNDHDPNPDPDGGASAALAPRPPGSTTC
jgi:hypothetical protein